MNDALILKLLRAAEQRLTAAEFLLKQGSMYLESIYLAGYTVEISLKALLLFHTPKAKRLDFFNSFKGRGWHDFEHLRRELRNRNCVPSEEVGRLLTRVSSWTTDLRYEVGVKAYTGAKGAEDFFDAALQIRMWAKEVIT